MSPKTTSALRRWSLLGALLVLAALAWRLSAVERGGRGTRHASGARYQGTELRADLAAEPTSVVPGPVPRVSAGDRALAQDGERGVDGVGLRVHVRSSYGKPIVDARVQAFEAAVPLVRTTNEDGECVLPLPPSKEPVRVRVEATGFVHVSCAVNRRETVWFDLLPASLVRGRVLGADSRQPIGGARLRFFHPDCDGCGPDVVVSGPDGAFQLAEVPRFEETRLDVEAEGFVPLEQLEFVLHTDEPEVEQDVLLVRGSEVHGRVHDWVTLAGIPGARVAGLVADAEGRFHGRLVADPGTTTTRVEVRAAGYGTLRAPVDLAREGALEFRLPQLVRIEGELLGEDGQPIPGAGVFVKGHGPAAAPAGAPLESSPLYEQPAGHVYAVPDTAPDSTPDSSGEADSAGRYRVDALPWSLNLELIAHQQGYHPRSRLFPRLGEPGSTLEVSFRLQRELTSGTWVEGHVFLNGSTSDELRGSVAWQGPTRAGEMRFAGQYELAVEPGPLALRFHVDCVAEGLVGSELSVHVRPDERLLQPVFLRVASTKIAGRARFEDGSPFPRVHVSARAQDGVYATDSRSNERGEFELDVPDLGGVFTVRAGFLDQNLAREGIAAGSRDVEFVFARRYPLLVRFVEAATGACLRHGDHVRLFARSGRRLFEAVALETDTPDLAGWIEVWLSARSVDLLARPVQKDLSAHGLGLVHDLELVTPDGRPPRVELALARAAPLVLELDPRAGPWPEERRLLLVEEELLGELWNTAQGPKSSIPGLVDLRRIAFDEHGRAELAGCEPGRYRFVVWPAGLALDPPEVVVEARAGLPVPVSWRPAR